MPRWPAVALSLAMAAFGVAACRGGFRGPTPGTPPPSAEFIHPADLQPGDCFDVIETQAAEPLAARLLPCTVPHDVEVYGAFSDPAAPGEPFYLPTLERRADEECGRRYREFVEGSFLATQLLYVFYYPAEEAWLAGARGITCALSHPEGKKLTRSYRKP